jgi:concanavalin A-like lectin/glucanase superfamily protein
MTTRRGARQLLLTAAALVLAAPAAASAAVTVSYWHMNETSGSTMVDSASGLNGTLTNVGLGVPAVFSPGYSFNGSSSIATVPHNGYHNVPANTTFTVTTHVRFPAVPSASVGDFDLIRKGLSSTSGGHWKVEIFTNGKAYCRFDGSNTSKTINDGPNLADNRWHTIQCIKRTSSLSLVVDGVSFTSNVTIGAISNTSRLAVGAKYGGGGGDWYKGIMDEVSIVLG